MGSAGFRGGEHWSDGWGLGLLRPEFPRLTRCHRCEGFFRVSRAKQLGEFEDPASSAPRYDVRLEAAGTRRVELMALLRGRSKRSLVEVKALLEGVPSRVAAGLLHESVLALVSRLRAVGASASVQEARPDETRRAPHLPPEWTAAPWVRVLDERELGAVLSSGLAESREDQVDLRLRAWWASNDPYRKKGVPWRRWAERAPEARENLWALCELLSEEDPLECVLKAEALREQERFEEARTLVGPGSRFERLGASIREWAEQGLAEVRLLTRKKPTP